MTEARTTNTRGSMALTSSGSRTGGVRAIRRPDDRASPQAGATDEAELLRLLARTLTGRPGRRRTRESTLKKNRREGPVGVPKTGSSAPGYCAFGGCPTAPTISGAAPGHDDLEADEPERGEGDAILPEPLPEELPRRPRPDVRGAGRSPSPRRLESSDGLCRAHLINSSDRRAGHPPPGIGGHTTGAVRACLPGCLASGSWRILQGDDSGSVLSLVREEAGGRRRSSQDRPSIPPPGPCQATRPQTMLPA
jgi:hypothetical protein